MTYTYLVQVLRPSAPMAQPRGTYAADSFLDAARAANAERTIPGGSLVLVSLLGYTGTVSNTAVLRVSPPTTLVAERISGDGTVDAANSGNLGPA